jgi:hypothetical protein
MDIVIVRGSVIYENKKYIVGQVINIAEAEAQRLIKLGVAVQTTAEKKEEQNPPDSLKGEQNPTGQEQNPPDPQIDFANITRDDLAQELSLRGIGFKSSASKEHMIQLYKEAMAK